MGEKQLDAVIWNIIFKYKNNKFNFTKKGFKGIYSVSQLFGPLNNNILVNIIVTIFF